jgi:hypothetical protein
VVFAVLALPFAVLAVVDQGMVWSDEIFQTMEQAHRLAFGYGLVPWEFQQGARFWLLPALLALPMKLLAALGVQRGLGLAIGCKLLFALGTGATFAMGVNWAFRLAGRAGALLLGLMAVSFPPTLLYGHRALSEVASAPLLMGMILLLGAAGLDAAGVAGVARRRLLAAGVLGGLLTLVRYQNAVLLPAVVLLVAFRYRVGAALWLAAAASAVLLAGGLADWWMWGQPFHSLVVYLRFNLFSNGANQWGVAPATFFLHALFSASGPLLLVLALGFVLGLRALWPVAILVVLFVLAHSLIAHKELRFIFPALPLFLLVAAVGLSRLANQLRPRRAFLMAGLTGVALALPWAVKARALTFADIGQTMNPYRWDGPREPSAWGAYAEINGLLDQAGRQADLCGVAVPERNGYWTGGYTYLHRRVPLLWHASPRDLAATNYVVAAPEIPFRDSRYRPVAEWREFKLLRRDGPCEAPAAGAGRVGRMIPEGIPGS